MEDPEWSPQVWLEDSPSADRSVSSRVEQIYQRLVQWFAVSVVQKGRRWRAWNTLQCREFLHKLHDWDIRVHTDIEHLLGEWRNGWVQQHGRSVLAKPLGIRRVPPDEDRRPMRREGVFISISLESHSPCRDWRHRNRRSTDAHRSLDAGHKQLHRQWHGLEDISRARVR